MKIAIEEISLQDADFIGATETGAIIAEFVFSKSRRFCIHIKTWKENLKTSVFAIDPSLKIQANRMSLYLLDPEVINSKEVYALLSTVPKKVLERIFEFKDFQIQLLQLASFDERVLDLLDSNPNLLFLYLSRLEKPITNDDACILLKSQRVILKRLFLNEVLSVNFIRKINCEFRRETYQKLHRLLYNPKLIHGTKHLPVIYPELLGFLEKTPILLRTRIYNSVLEKQYLIESDSIGRDITISNLLCWNASTLSDAMKMAEQLGVFSENNFLKLNSIEKLKTYHDQLMRMQWEKNSPEDLQIPSVDFPPPPWGGTKDIIPIWRAEDLKQEGKDMQHCIFSYVFDISRGESYAYKVLFPERATLLVRPDNGILRFDEIQLKGNETPMEETKNFVKIKLGKAKITEEFIQFQS